ncbi:MAG: hypothetical protein QM791_20830 [Ferruginibacter sp.]
MAKPTKVLVIYLLSLFLFSLLMTWMKLPVVYTPFKAKYIQVNIIMIATIIGGTIALRLLVTTKALRIFLIIYGCLWLLRFLILFLAYSVKEISFFGKTFQVNQIAPNYYTTISRLGTPLPFIIFWFITYIFSKDQAPKTNVPEEVQE